MKIADCHSHSEFSPDSKTAIPVMCEAAINSGLGVFAVTDHCECNAFYSDGYNNSIKASVSGALNTKEAYKDRLTLLAGVELGQPLQALQEAELIVNSYDFDIVLASLHNNNNCIDFYHLKYNPDTVGELLSDYFKELYDMVMWGKFNVLAHMTYPIRYITGTHGIKVDMNKFDDIVGDILEALIKKGIALEINTSGLFQPLKETVPNMDIVRKYYNLGGRMITLGSDAHGPEAVGRGFKQVMDNIKTIGFDKITYFEKRQPKFINTPFF